MTYVRAPYLPTTWFERNRGVASGRVPDGQGGFQFVLGNLGLDEAGWCFDGDYAELAQAVDLDGCDFLTAELATIAPALAYFTYPPAFQADDDTIALWRMDEVGPDAASWVIPGPALAAQGSLGVAWETYAAEATRCRRVPGAATAAHLAGVNTPRLTRWTGALSAYTLQVWLDFHASAHLLSDGINPTIVQMGLGADPLDAGLRLRARGVLGVGARQWYLYHAHHSGTTLQEVYFPNWSYQPALGGDPGWTLLTVVYDSTETGTSRLKLYVNDALASLASATPTVQPGALALDAPIQVGHKDLIGDFDQVRLLDVALDATEVADSYDACIAAAVANPAVWTMQWLIDGAAYAERRVQPSEQRAWRDFRVPVRGLTGTHTVTLRLRIDEET